LILERTQAGRERAQALGVKFGRKPRLSATMREKIVERRLAGESIAELARDYGCGLATIHRAVSA
jgi:DNA invertase Pin-like site-specific DNA recombinase